jgi:hypothetical protein
MQIENEYQMVEPAFGSSGQRYVSWAAAMAVDLQTGVPWTMCKQNDAPDPAVGIHSHTIPLDFHNASRKFQRV